MVHKLKPSQPRHQSNILRSAVDAHMTPCCLTKSNGLASAAVHAIGLLKHGTIWCGTDLMSTSNPSPFQNFLASTSCPEIQGYLYVKELGRKSWKKVYMFLRRSGLYCSTKGTSKVTGAHSFHLQSTYYFQSILCYGHNYYISNRALILHPILFQWKV